MQGVPLHTKALNPLAAKGRWLLLKGACSNRRHLAVNSCHKKEVKM